MRARAARGGGNGGASGTSDSPPLATLLGFLGMSATAVDTSPRIATSALAVASGDVALGYFTPLVDLPITTITIGCSSTASGLTLAKYALFTAAANDDLTLVARTASNTSIFAVGNTNYPLTLATAGGWPASYALVAGTRYAVGVLQVGTPATVRAAGGSGQSSALAPRVGGKKTGQTDITGDLTGITDYTGNVAGGIWARLS